MSVHYGGRGPGHIARAQGNRTDWIFTSGGLDGRITFTRASSGTYFDSAGVMQTATTDVPRFNYEYNGTSWVAKGLLVEPTATNLLLRSREFDNASWTKVDTTITANAANGVDGAATMDLCTEGSAGTSFVRQTVTIVANSTNTFAIDLKRGNTDWYRLIMYEGVGTNYVQAWFNLATGAVGSVQNGGTGTGAAASIRNLGNGIYRCIVTGAVNNSATSIICTPISASADGSNTRVANATRYQDRAQLESGSVATSFIETTAATATRAADVASVTGSNFSSWFNPVEGTFVVEMDSVAPANTTLYYLLSVQNLTATERLYAFEYNGAWGATALTASATQFDLKPPGSYSPGVAAKIAFGYKTNDFAVSVNGSSPLTDLSGSVPVPDRLFIGSVSGSSSFLNGHIRRFTYYPTRLSDAQLATLSTL